MFEDEIEAAITLEAEKEDVGQIDSGVAKDAEPQEYVVREHILAVKNAVAYLSDNRYNQKIDALMSRALTLMDERDADIEANKPPQH